MITLSPKSFTVRLTTPAGVVFFSADPSPAFRLVLAPAIRGERGPVGPQGTVFAVSATPPDDPFEATGSALMPVAGLLAATETGEDLLAASGLVLVQGGLTATETDTDGFAGAGVVVVSGGMRIYAGGVWVRATMKARVDGAWRIGKIKRWTGAEWKETG